MGFSSHAQIYCNGGEELTGSLSSVESDRPCTSTKPEPVERGACSELRASYVCNMQWPGHNRSSARAFAVNPSRLPARPFGLRGLTAKARPSKGVCRAINAELRLHEPRSKWKQERAANFVLDNESPIQGWDPSIGRRIAASRRTGHTSHLGISKVLLSAVLITSSEWRAQAPDLSRDSARARSAACVRRRRS